MKNRISNARKIIFAALFMFALAIGAAAQSVTFKQGDTVQTPDARRDDLRPPPASASDVGAHGALRKS